MKLSVIPLLTACILLSCKSYEKQPEMKTVKLATLDPGHFHAALVQKTMYKGIDSGVYVYAPDGDEVNEHLKRIESYNTRIENPTAWNEVVYKGDDFLSRMLAEKKGNVVILAGNNEKKINYIQQCVGEGMNVLADKPMIISFDDFDALARSFESASRQGLILYDIMTERSEITTILQKELSLDKELFGNLIRGTADEPAVTKESVHHFFKYVSGQSLKRPAWFFDVTQQGEGLTDVSTHLVDLIQWECFPEQIIDYKKDIEIVTAKRSATILSPAQFRKATQQRAYPGYLAKDVRDSMLHVYANGEMVYTIKGIYAKVSVLWNFEAPEGTGDTHFSIMRGTKANLIIRQGKEQSYKPVLYIEPVEGISPEAFKPRAEAAMVSLQQKYPDIQLKSTGNQFEIVIPDHYRIGHEEHFAQVMERFLKYIGKGMMPEWEVPNMLAKYYTTTRALEMAKNKE